MEVREKMRKWREEQNLTYKDLSNRSGVSSDLIGMVENGDVTHPLIAKQLQELYSLSDEETLMLMPKIHRPNDPEYEPDRYVSVKDKQFRINKTKSADKELYEYRVQRFKKYDRAF